jgi:predicted DNA-binding protein YlxM (UPF0122 family)
MTEKAAQPKRRADWDAVERDYRTGKFTLRELADKYGVSHQAIGKQVKTKGWTQDLSTAIKQATNAKLVAELVDKEVAKGGQEVAKTVLAAAELNKQVILKHRGDISKTSDLAMAMLAELSLTTHKQEEIEELFEKVTGDMAGPALLAAQQQFKDFMRVHSRVGSVHKLADTLAKLQTLERKAFGIADEGEGKEPAAVEPIFNITLTQDGRE